MRPALARTLLAALAAIALLGVAACGGRDEAGTSAGEVTLSLVAYTTPREVYEELVPAFQETEAGRGVTFDQSYGASGEQSRAVEAGLPADVVALSLEPDVTRLADAGLVGPDWNADEHAGMVSNSVVVFVVREGNPKGIETWDDLLRDDVEVLTPNPFTSGGARWNVMAAYGAQLAQGRSDEEAIDYLRAMFANVAVQDKGARESLTTFAAGKGDVLLAYENEAIFARQQGQALDYVLPSETILIENPVAVVNASDNAETAQAFVDFLREPDSQRVFGEKGYRPILDDVLAEFDYEVPAELFTIADLGGWPDVMERFFDVEGGVMADINSGLGVETG